MNILYISCHSVLEYNEITMFQEMGHNVFSTGTYYHPDRPIDKLRPALPMTDFARKMIDKFAENSVWSIPNPYSFNEALPENIIDEFDVIIAMHEEKFIWQNIKKFEHKDVIYRAIGQENPNTEQSLHRFRNDFGFKVVGFSEMEQTRQAYAGRDATIYFHDEPVEFPEPDKDYGVVNFSRGLNTPARYRVCNGPVIKEMLDKYPLKIYGQNNPDFMNTQNRVPVLPEKQRQIIKGAKAYFYTGTNPSFYTLAFIEAFSSGTPIVAVKNKLMETETDRILNGENGFAVNTVDEAIEAIKSLEDPDLAQKIGENAKADCARIFSKEKAKEEWTKLFSSLS